MLERELKFHVPAARRNALAKALLAEGAQELHLQAKYFDTPQRHLARARVALRLRNEDGQWVQTIKMPGSDPLTRFEHNTARPNDTLDLSCYRDTPAAQILGKLKPKLATTYETDVKRLVLRIEHMDTIIELAYDRGQLRSGATTLPIDELELELISGGSDALFSLAEHWQQAYGLVLELRSKSERGDALAALVSNCDSGSPDLSRLPAVQRATSITLQADSGLRQAYVQCASECLTQVIRNAASLAGIDSEHATTAQRVTLVHQLRVGVRRLRSCWQFFRPWVSMDASQQAAELRRYFSLFGETRDDAVVQTEIAPQLLKAGMPPFEIPSSTQDPDRPVHLAASAGFQTTLLRLLGQLLELQSPAISTLDELSAEPLPTTLVRRLNKWLRQVAQEGQAFSQLPAEAQHDLRKRIKRLRYSLDFSQALLGDGAQQDAVRDALGNTQRTLGELNDLYTAETLYLGMDQTQPGVWFALGWLRAMQQQRIAEAETCFHALADAGTLKAAKSGD